MAVNYKAVAKKNPLKQTDPPKYYAQMVSKGELTLRQLAKDISAISTISTADTMAVLEGMLEIIPKELGNGNIIRLGDFGSFILSVSSDGAESIDKLTSLNIRKSTVKFRPGKEFTKAIATIDFNKIT